MHYNYNNSLINYLHSVLLPLCYRILGNGVVYHLASGNISLCFTTLNCSNKANGYWKELAICLYFLLLLLRRRIGMGGGGNPTFSERMGNKVWPKKKKKKLHHFFFVFKVRSKSHLDAVQMNGSGGERSLLCGFGVISRPAIGLMII